MSKSKLTRSALKAVIKECLVEILAEGIGPSTSSLNEQTSSRQSSKAPTRRRKKPQPSKTSDKFDAAVKKSASALTSDPVMSAIFEDTARTTLQEQREAPGSQMSTPPMAANSETGVNPDELFEGSSNWATLAFAEKKTV